MNQQSIGKYLAEKREQHNLTQNELAAKLGIKEKLVEKWEKGAKLPKASQLAQLCEIFGFSKSEFLAGRDLSAEEKIIESEKQLAHFLEIKDDAQECWKLGIIFKIAFLVWAIITLWQDNLTCYGICMMGIFMVNSFSGRWISRNEEIESVQEANKSIVKEHKIDWSEIAIIVASTIATIILFFV